MTSLAPPRSVWLALVFAAIASCTTDPVQERAEDALGDEDPRVGARPEHRAGQPCTVCHQPHGSASNAFALAGTIVYGPTKQVGLAGARVEVLDSRPGVTKPRVAYTNCAGNFFFRAEDTDLQYPLIVRVVPPGGSTIPMRSAVYREKSCANCHQRTASPRSPGPIVVASADQEARQAYAPPADCVAQFPWLVGGAP
jgi:mono/diheme cytochrome c family protein